MANTSGLNIQSIGLWLLKILVAAVFVAAAVSKLLAAPMMVAEFGLVGLGQGFRVFTALLELGGAALLLTPRTSRYGALVLFTVCVGAGIAQISRIHGDLVHVVVLLALTGFLAWTGGVKRA